MAKPGYILIAEHFGTDSETVRDHEYQPGRYSKPVYDFGDGLWAGGKIKPKAFDGSRDDFKKVISSYDNKSILWHLRNLEE